MKSLSYFKAETLELSVIVGDIVDWCFPAQGMPDRDIGPDLESHGGERVQWTQITEYSSLPVCFKSWRQQMPTHDSRHSPFPPFPFPILPPPLLHDQTL